MGHVGSLFSGIGGIELGFEREGFETKWFIENNEYCQAVLRKTFPNIPIYGDISTVDFTRLESVDILTGGFPCQDISCANPRGEGITGERSGLWSYYKETIRVLRPRYAVIENVPNLANKGLNVVLGDLAEIGYDAEWEIISAREVGARHLRRRLFIVAYPNCEPQYVRADEERGERRDESAQFDIAASNSDVPNTDKLNGNDGEYAASEILRGRPEKTELSGGKKGVAKPHTARLQGHGRSFGSARELFTTEVCLQLRELQEQNMRGIWRADPADEPCEWSAQSRVGRVVNGIPQRVDRLKCLGNAVVPQVAQFIARRIREIEK